MLDLPPLPLHVTARGSMQLVDDVVLDNVQLIEDETTSLLLLELTPSRVLAPTALPWRIALASVCVASTLTAMLLPCR